MEQAMQGYFTAIEDCQALCYEMPSYQGLDRKFATKIDIEYILI